MTGAAHADRTCRRARVIGERGSGLCSYSLEQGVNLRSTTFRRSGATADVEESAAGEVGSPAWSGPIRSASYSEQPLGLGTRLFGIGGVALTSLFVLGGVLLTWRVYPPATASSAISVFEVRSSAVPEEPVERPPAEPVSEDKEQPTFAQNTPKIDPLEIQIGKDSPAASLPPKPVFDTTPQIERAAPPEVRPQPPAPPVGTGKSTWEGLVLAALNKAKRYPRYAQSQGQQGTPWIRFTMNREGKVLSVKLDRSASLRALDEEALALPKRAQPLPKPPQDVQGEVIELIVPIEFLLG